MNVIGADPFVFYDKKDSLYYAYCTTEVESEKTFRIYSSKDLQGFHDEGMALDLTKKRWSKDWYWAPEVIPNEKTGLYFLFYSARVKDGLLEHYFGDPHYEEGCKIGVAVATSPKGPFVNIEDKPIDYYPYDPSYRDINVLLANPKDPCLTPREAEKAPQGVYLSSIDASPYYENGHFYLYFSRCCYRNYVYDEKLGRYIEESNICVVELDPAFYLDPKGQTAPKILPSYRQEGNGRRHDRFVNVLSYERDPQEWENGHIDDFKKSQGEKKDRRWEEGPSLFPVNLAGQKAYGLTFSANNFENGLYGVGIAFGASPLGPFKKYPANPIIHADPAFPIYSTGHGSPVHYENQLHYLFHGREASHEPRILYEAPLSIDEKQGVRLGAIRKGFLK